jgi:hypothetical protein
MPPRLSKRQQREKEALNELGLGTSAEDGDSSQNEAISKFATVRPFVASENVLLICCSLGSQKFRQKRVSPKK